MLSNLVVSRRKNLKGFQDVVERKFLGINDGIFLEFSGAMGKLSLAEAT